MALTNPKYKVAAVQAAPAFLDLDATNRQLALATKTRELANQQLTQARDRFAAGVANNVEVVQAQDAVAIATEQYIDAQYGYDLAKGALVRGTGTSIRGDAIAHDRASFHQWPPRPRTRSSMSAATRSV